MNNVTIFWIQLLTSVFVFAIVTAWYVWPALTKLSRNAALIPLLFVHVFRYVGMTLLVTDMIDQKLPRDFLSSAAYGDLLEAALALASIFALRSNWRVAVPLVWVANTWGFVDLLNGVRGVLQLKVPSFNLARAIPASARSCKTCIKSTSARPRTLAEGVRARRPAFISFSKRFAKISAVAVRRFVTYERISVTRSDCPSAAAAIMQPPRASPVAVLTVASQKAVTALWMSGSA